MLRVLVVDDDAMVRRLLRQVLTSADIEVVAEAADGDEVVQKVQAHHPDVVLMDLRMARVDGIAATRTVCALPSPPGVLAMTSFDTEESILAAVRAGASGFIAKDAEPAEIVGAVRAVAGGEGALSPRAARTMVERVVADPSTRVRSDSRRMLETLTEREIQIARGVADGLSNAEIARTTYLSEATVKSHLTQVMAKLGASNRVLVALVVERASLGRPD